MHIFREIWEMVDLRKRVLFTLGMLAIYRAGIFVPAPGINRDAMSQWAHQQDNTLFGLYNMFSGGALEQFSVFVLGIMPYITASIIMQLLAEIEPRMRAIKEDGQAGQAKLGQYSRYLTIGIAIVQSFFLAVGFEQMTAGASSVVIDPGWSFRLLTVATMTAGACFVMWLGEQMTDNGVGNGASIIITCGIIAGLPAHILQFVQTIQNGQINLLNAVVLVVGMLLVVYGIVFIERGQRRVPLRHARRVMGNTAYEGQTTYLPLKVNTSGVIPPIFASSLLMMPATLTQISFLDNAFTRSLTGALYPGRWLYNVVFIGLIVFFTFLYTAIQFKPEDVADNLRRQGGFIPRVRPGRETAAYLDWLLTRLTAGGAIYLAAVCVLPMVLIGSFGVPFYFGGTSLLILVGVCLDTVGQVQAQLSTRHYGVLSNEEASGRIRNRRRQLGGAGPFLT